MHKKYIIIRGRKYGPYYYESYREDGKVKKRYIKISEKKEEIDRRVKKLNNDGSKTRLNLFLIFDILIIISILFLVLFSFVRFYAPFVEEIEIGKVLLSPPGASSSVNGDANLTIWDITDDGENRFSGIPVQFYANYTQHSTKALIDNDPSDGISGSCQIQYNDGAGFSGFVAMSFDAAIKLWKVENIFFRKGNHLFEVSCTSSFSDVVLQNGFVISNSEPDIFETPGGFVNFDGNSFNNDILNCVEDSLCIYNFSANVSDPDLNDVLTYRDIPSPNSTLTNFVLNSAGGILEILVDNTLNKGQKRLELQVEDSEGRKDNAVLQVFISEVNDPPKFIGLENKEFNISFLFEYIINVNDEENDAPFRYNISFIWCDTADFSARNDVDCELFAESDYTTDDGLLDNLGAINISFIPTKNDVGVYTINFTVWDLNNTVQPYNASRSVLVNFTVKNINDAPFFNYVCDNERESVEDSKFSCYINASDFDEVNNLTFTSNESWFKFNNSDNSITVVVGAATMFNGSALVNFTAGDSEVGNWSINVTVTDTGGLSGHVRQNSTKFWFFIDNIDDNVLIHPLKQFTAYTTTPFYTLYFNATDDDLLIPDKTIYAGKNIYPEVLSFNSNETWVSVSTDQVVAGSNRTVGIIQFNPNNAAVGLHRVNISVIDSKGDVDYFIFNITIELNNPIVWDVNTPLVHVFNEDDKFYLNLSQYVSDADVNDIITFSYVLEPGIDFNGFKVNSTTGVINFTPEDFDVGQHIVRINATDGKLSVGRVFNFTVKNMNDPVIIKLPLSGNSNVTFDANSNIDGIFEDNYAEIYLLIEDDDLLIPPVQKGFYQEVHNINLVLEPSTNLMKNFIFAEVLGLGDIHRYTSSFIPRKADVGIYNVSINASDASGSSSFLIINMTIAKVDHPPLLMNLSDQFAAVNGTLFYDINASDIEEGNDSSGNLTFSIIFLPDGKADNFYLGNESVFNSTFGILNVTFNDTQAGRYHLNITVSDLPDTIILRDSGDFWIYVYDVPVILSPPEAIMFDLKEGISTDITFIANSSAGGNLTYELYFGGNLRQSISYYGNATSLVWGVVPSYADETYGVYGNMTLVVLVPSLEFLNTSRTWNTNITHSNAPLRFIKEIDNQIGSVGTPIIINLSEHFADEDAFDVHYNDTVNFIVNHLGNNSLITSEVVDWELGFSSSTLAVEWFNVSGFEINRSGSVLSNTGSNNFSVEFKEPKIVQVPVPQPTSGGGGGGSSEKQKPVSLRLILPDPVSAFRGQIIVLPITLENGGPVDLHGIHLSSLIAKDGLFREDIEMNLSKDFVERLGVGQRDNVTLIVRLGTLEQGLYEITLNADVDNPVYSDWGKIFINVNEGETVIERLVFVDELIAENPECAEIQELVDESRVYLMQGKMDLADSKLNEAVNACKDVISQQSFFSGRRFREKLQDRAFIYLLIATIIAVILGIFYYSYRTVMFRKALRESAREDSGNVSFASEKV